MLSQSTNNKNLYAYLERNVKHFPNKPYLIYKGESLSFRQVKDMVDRFASAMLECGLPAASPVALLIPNIPEFIIAYYAVLRAGYVAVPLNILYTTPELETVLKSCQVKALIYWGNFEDRVNEIKGKIDTLGFLFSIKGSGSSAIDFHSSIEHHPRLEGKFNPAPDDDAVILFTAGDVDSPRGVRLSHKNITSNAEACANLASLSNEDRFLGVIPFFYGFGHTTVMNLSLILGSGLVILDKLDVAVLVREIKDQKVSVIIGVPSVFRKILQYAQKNKVDFSSVKLCFSGGSHLPLDLYRKFESTFGIPILQGYGLTECSPVVSFNQSPLHNTPQSVGVPIDGVEMKLVNGFGRTITNRQIGELYVRGESVAKGYVNSALDKKYFMEDGWFRTGDLFFEDEKGFYYYIGKKSNVIIKYGFEIYPEEIETRLRKLPEIKEVVVVGFNDSENRKLIRVCIVPSNDQKSTEKIENFIRSELKPYAQPDEILYMDKLPRNSTGKVIRSRISGNLKI